MSYHYTPLSLIQSPAPFWCGMIIVTVFVLCELMPLEAQGKVVFTSNAMPRATDDNVSVEDQASRAVVRAFLRQFPQYEIKPFVMPKIQGATMDMAPLMGIASGNPPHAIYVNFRQSSSYINHGYLAPIEELLARILSDDETVRETHPDGRWKADPSQEEIELALRMILQRVPDPVVPVIYREADVKREGIPEGKHIWAMPINTLVRALLYRKDVFLEAGLDPESPPDDWDELIAYARRIRTLPNTYGLYFEGGRSISWGAYSFMVSNGVNYMVREPGGKWLAAFNTEAAAESIYFIAQLTNGVFQEDGRTYRGVAYVPMGGGMDAKIKWERGQFGMQFDYLDQELLADINPELVGVAPIPKSPNGGRGGELNCRMLGVFAGSTPEQKLGIMRYIWFITGDEAQRIRTQVFVENGFGRFVNPDMLEKFGYDDILRRVPRGWRDTYRTALESGVPEPYGQNTQFVYHVVSEPVNWALQQPLLDLPRDQALMLIRIQLDEAASRMDKYMLGELPQKEWSKRRAVATGGVVLLLTLFTGSLYFIWRSFARQEMFIGDRPPLSRFIPAYVMIVPAMAIVVFWHYLPATLSAPLAMFSYEIVISSKFVGIDNFATVLFDERFWLSLARTFYYVALVVGLGFWPPILVAILLDEVPTTTLKYVFRTVFYLPAIVSGVIMVFLWRQLFEPSESGFLNQALLFLNHFGPVSATIVKLVGLLLWLSLIFSILLIAWQLSELTWPVRGAVFAFALVLLAGSMWPLIEAYTGPTALEIEAMLQQNSDAAVHNGWSGVWYFFTSLFGSFNIKPFGWIQDPRMAMICCVIPGVWAAAGPGCIIYLAALKTVPDELVEAATVDGAGILQKVVYITLPRIKFLILIQLVGAIVGAFKGGTNFILAMTGGGPNGATRTLGMDIFERTFMELQYGIGAAMAWILGGIVIVLTAIQLKRISRAQFRTI